MTVAELIEKLKQLPQDYTVFREGGDYKDDWREVDKVEVARWSTLGTLVGVYLE
jgi:hypothetical protein